MSLSTRIRRAWRELLGPANSLESTQESRLISDLIAAHQQTESRLLQVIETNNMAFIAALKNTTDRTMEYFSKRDIFQNQVAPVLSEQTPEDELDEWAARAQEYQAAGFEKSLEAQYFAAMAKQPVDHRGINLDGQSGIDS